MFGHYELLKLEAWIEKQHDFNAEQICSGVFGNEMAHGKRLGYLAALRDVEKKIKELSDNPEDAR